MAGMSGLDDDYVKIGFSLFRMGPARTLLVLGQFFPWIWAVGALYIFSSILKKEKDIICLFEVRILFYYLQTFGEGKFWGC